MLKSSSIKEDENKEENEHNGEEIRQKVDSSDMSLTSVTDTYSSYWLSLSSVSSVGSSMDLFPRRPRPKSGLPTGGPTINSTALNYI